MSAQQETRGWEVSDTYTAHPLDDPDYDIVRDESEGGATGVILLGVLVVVLWIGTYLAGQYLAPPPVNFNISPPMPTIVIRDLRTQWVNLPACREGYKCVVRVYQEQPDRK